jgi:phenylalanyl-tRNA synthetase alpha chain
MSNLTYQELLVSIPEIVATATKDLQQVTTLAQLEQVKSQYIGKNGKLSVIIMQIKNVPPEQRKMFGEQINLHKTQIEQIIATQYNKINEDSLNQQIATQHLDISLYGRGNRSGALHPISLCLHRMISILTQLGFSIGDGPEIETDYYNFVALNFPNNHPARAMQDTFYTANGNILRTHTSPVQIRYAGNHKPPIKLIAPGRVYRVDMDKTHSPMFHQLECLWVEENISFANLKWIISTFLRQFFADDSLEIRFRTSFFPFTEPSAEIDIKDKLGNWLEVGGCGMVHPEVLKYMNIDANQYTGFAFGLGIDRFAMLRYQISDLRLLFDNDLDFLNQFKGQTS